MIAQGATNMSLKDRLKSERQEQKGAAERLPAALEAVQALHRAVKAYLVENEIAFKEGEGNLTHTPQGWQSVPFPKLLVVVRNHTTSVCPRGFTPEGFRIDFTCAACNHPYCFMWNGNGNSISDWEMFPVFNDGRADRTKGSPVNNETLDQAFTKMAGFED
jgi:hypothetical protein